MSRKRRALTFDEENGSLTSKGELSSENLTPGDENKKIIEITMESIAPEISHVTNDSPTMCKSYPNTETEDNSVQSCDTNKKPRKNFEKTEDTKNSKYSDLIKKYGVRECAIKLVDLDTDNRKSGGKRRSSPRLCPKVFVNNQVEKESVHVPDFQDTPLELAEMGQITPKKNPVGAYELSSTKLLSFDFLTPTKLSTPTRLVVSFTDAVRKAVDLDPAVSLCTVNEFYRLCMRLIPTYFQEVNSLGTERCMDFFKDAMKQVFPWFDTAQLEDEVVNLPSANMPNDSRDSPIVSEEPEDVKMEVDIEQVDVRPAPNISDQDMSHECIMFEDLYWSIESFMDYRVCSFCAEIGDFPTQSCGRLLYAGPEDWVHVNCALWSSEVWEEDTGGLQQVEIALTRGKRTKCSYCEQPGATLNCCTGSCKRCFHFMCAMHAGCFLMENKTMFCQSHEQNAKGSLQKDMHVSL